MTHPPGDPPTDEVIARLCADYLDHLNGAGGRSRADFAAIPLAPQTARRLREALDLIDQLHKNATRPPRSLTRPPRRTTLARGAASIASRPPENGPHKHPRPEGGRTLRPPPTSMDSKLRSPGQGETRCDTGF